MYIDREREIDICIRIYVYTHMRMYIYRERESPSCFIVSLGYSTEGRYMRDLGHIRASPFELSNIARN